MKYVIFIILLFIGCVKSYSHITISIHTNLNGFHCDGKQGLCSIDNQEDRMLSNATLTLQNNQLTIKIDRNKLSAIDEINIYGKTIPVAEDIPTFFNDTEPSIIPEAISKQLTRSDVIFTIEKEAYLITTSEHFISVIFNLE